MVLSTVILIPALFFLDRAPKVLADDLRAQLEHPVSALS